MSSLSMRSYKSKTCNLFQVQFGNKKQGLTPSIGKSHWASIASKTRAEGTQSGRNLIFPNGGQMSGVGAGVSSFSSQGNNWSQRGGVRRFAPYSFSFNKVAVILRWQALLTAALTASTAATADPTPTKLTTLSTAINEAQAAITYLATASELSQLSTLQTLRTARWDAAILSVDIAYVSYNTDTTDLTLYSAFETAIQIATANINPYRTLFDYTFYLSKYNAAVIPEA